MDGFFEEYGRMIIVAVAICFALLYLTPMQNVVGSSINGFAGNFANKVGESLGTVKMPDGSGGATNSEKVKMGDTLDIEGTKYVVLEERENNQALVTTASIIRNKFFHADYSRADGQNINTYEGSTIDTYLENKWYKSLSSIMQSAIQTTNIKQASYAIKNDPDSKQETGYNGQVYNTINRHVFLPSVSEIGKVVDLKSQDKVKAFLNGTNAWIWTRDSHQGSYYKVVFLGAYSGSVSRGSLGYNDVGDQLDVRPAFVIDLSKVDYKTVGHTDYK